MQIEEIVFENDTYVAVPEKKQNSCKGCGFYSSGDYRCENLSSTYTDFGDCRYENLGSICTDNAIIWLKKTDVISTKELDNSSNGKKYDQGKNRYDLIPAKALDEAVKVLTAGAVKYNESFDEENWRKVSYPQRRYFAAAMRHLWAAKRGEANDPETGISHYAHAITNLMFLLELDIEGKEKENNE